MKPHKHNWVKLYYRKYQDNSYADWIKVENKVICLDCLKIAEIKVKDS
jgi:hypothetical protein